MHSNPPKLLFDDLVGAQHDRWGYGKAKRRGGLAVHDHLVFHRKLHREIARLGAAQNAIDIGSGTTHDVCPSLPLGTAYYRGPFVAFKYCE